MKNSHEIPIPSSSKDLCEEMNMESRVHACSFYIAGFGLSMIQIIVLPLRKYVGQWLKLILTNQRVT